ncbi:SDR family oxidoreductase [Streptomyces sp. SudanB52_2052]|uniref:SDR family oxidoreductase n=1 Tax=Streptomyces sp. SudanB52_2052 TaxID=3035276 RepID=UPI003F56BD2B
MGRLDEQVALVTGGAGGIGTAVARALAAEGAAVVIADIRDAEGTDLAARLGGRARFTHLDVTSEDDWRRALAETERDLGPVSVLANIAGIIDWGPMEEQSPESFRRVVDVNLTGAWLGMRATAPSLRRAGGGVIVNMSSLSGLTAYAGVGAYAASKWGLRGLTKTAAPALAPDRVRVCSVHPSRPHPHDGRLRRRVHRRSADPRFGEPEEVARMVLFIVTDATFSTGCAFVLDGGVLAGPPTVLNPTD